MCVCVFFNIIFIYIYNLFDMYMCISRILRILKLLLCFFKLHFSSQLTKSGHDPYPLLSLRNEEIMLMVQKLLKQFICQISDYLTGFIYIYISTVVLDFLKHQLYVGNLQRITFLQLSKFAVGEGEGVGGWRHLQVGDPYVWMMFLFTLHPREKKHLVI